MPRNTDLARQLNAFASALKSQRSEQKANTIREAAAEYLIESPDDTLPLFIQTDLTWLEQSPISKL